MRPGKGPKFNRNWRLPALILFIILQPAYGQRSLINQFCVGCHSQRLKTGGIILEELDPASPGDHAEIWERVLRQVSAGQMPPPRLPRPDAAMALAFTNSLENALDRSAAAKPNPG